MAIAKRTNGNTGAYFDVFRKYCHDEKKEANDKNLFIEALAAIKKFADNVNIQEEAKG